MSVYFKVFIFRLGEGGRDKIIETPFFYVKTKQESKNAPKYFKNEVPERIVKRCFKLPSHLQTKIN